MYELQSEKRVAKLSVDGRIFYRIYHILGDLLTEVTLFELVKDPEDPKGLALTEIQPDEVPDTLKEKIFTDDCQVFVTKDDKELIATALATKFKFYQEIAKTRINAGFKRKILRFIETGGHYFAFVYEQGAPCTKLYHLFIDPIKKVVTPEGVEKPFLAPLMEALAPILLSNTAAINIQIGEKVYCRLARWEREPAKAVATVVVADRSKEDEPGLRLAGGFYLKSDHRGLWHAATPEEGEKKRLYKEMEKGFDGVYQELLYKVFMATGELPV
ncbi:hypothetical protein [Caldibacillus debilis]|uniref:Uncharacterized protein n=1 Tax=Caldibacillus debilis GB1 TaxID=1339248 RepID=A0A420VE98_9BACI|nr:hypothetical protein [Caldibacillus debilis]RKO61865.1 hypothetical protein Cdeb_01360 [Caldibacillus debilis GB1]